MRKCGSVTRRGLLASGASMLAVSQTSFWTATAAAPETARGHVVELVRGDRRGIAGVLVSNGIDVTRTDRNGAYSLPARDGVFVIKPANWTTPLDLTTGLPTFSYNHHPSGSPAGMRFGGSTATGPLPTSIDFILQRSPEPKSFTAVLLADPQPANARELSFLQAAMGKMCARRGLAFALALGDIAGDNLDIYGDYLKQAARLGAPVWHLPGNHDHDCDAPHPRNRLDTWRATFGPPTYAFEYAGAIFIMVDNVQPLPGSAYEGRIGLSGLAFIRNLLAFTPEDKLVVVCTHIPLTSSLGDDPSCATADGAELLTLLRGRKSVSFSGHMHTSEHHYLPFGDTTHHHQIIAALSGSWWSGPLDAQGHPFAIASDGTPHGWHLLSIDGTDFQTEFVSARDDAIGRAIFGDAVAGVTADMPLQTVAGAPAPFGLMVNVFDGGPRTRVFVEHEGVHVQLRHVLETDPYTRGVYEAAGATLKHWVSAGPSSHVWALDAAAFSALDPRRARLTIVDEFDRCRLDGAKLCAA